jgi:carbon storage regulator
MLVLTRRKNESLVIGDNITLTVLEVRGDRVRLAVSCPLEVPVHRQEVHDALHGLGRGAPRLSSPEEAAFLQAIAEDPADEGVRLVFADWLQERGDPLGEFIRTQCQRVRLPAGDGRRKGLEQRERALWGEHGAAWRARLPPVLWASA